MAKAQRRKNYFVKKKFQADFFLKFALLLALEAILIYALFMYVSRSTLTAAYRGMDFTIQRTNQYFLTDLTAIILIAGAAIAIMAAFIFMYLSHRIGGALYRFEITLEDAKDGNFAQRVKLRKNDELHDLNHRFNLFLETMDRRIADIKKETDKALAALKDAKQDNAKAAAEASLRSIQSSLERFKTTE